MNTSSAVENVIAVGNSGTGKTHVALGLGLAACQRGMSVGFTTAAALVHELMEARDERRLLNLQRQLSRLNLLIIDELGFVPLSRTGAELLFEVFSQRYERGSIMVTTNLPFDEWTEVFGSEPPHRRAAGPAHPPRPHPGDERRELPPQAQQGERCNTSPGRIRQPISRARSRPHSLTRPACCLPASVTLLPNNWRGHLRWPMTSLVVHFCSAPLVCFVDALDTSHPFNYGEWGFTAMAVNRGAVSSNLNTWQFPRPANPGPSNLPYQVAEKPGVARQSR